MACLAFYSLFNGLQHPELEYMQTIVKLDRIEQNIKEPMNMTEVEDFARGGEPRPTTTKSLDELLLDLEQIDNPKVTMEDIKARQGSLIKAKSIVKPPKLPDVETVEKKVTEHYEELQVLLTAEEKARAWMRQIGYKN